MKRFLSSCALVAFAVVVAMSSTPVDATLMTYNVTSPTSSSPGGWTVTGTITTPTTGTYTSSSGWTYNIAVSNGLATYTFSDLDDGDFLDGSIIATESSLSLGANSYFSLAQNATNYLSWSSINSGKFVFESYADSPSLFVIFSPTPTAGSAIGTAAPSSVPEIDPASFGSVAALLTGAFGLIEQRRRRRGTATALTA